LYWYNYSGAYNSIIILSALYKEEPLYMTFVSLMLFGFVNNLYVKSMLNLQSKDYNLH